MGTVRTTSGCHFAFSCRRNRQHSFSSTAQVWPPACLVLGSLSPRARDLTQSESKAHSPLLGQGFGLPCLLAILSPMEGHRTGQSCGGENTTAPPRGSVQFPMRQGGSGDSCTPLSTQPVSSVLLTLSQNQPITIVSGLFASGVSGPPVSSVR